MSAKVGVMAWQRPHLICSSTGSSWRFSSDDSGKVALEREKKKQPKNALQIKKYYTVYQLSKKNNLTLLQQHHPRGG